MKVCASCGFENAAAKNYCDRCGVPLSLAIPPAGRLQSGAPSAASEQLQIPSAPARTGAVYSRLRQKDRRQTWLFVLPLLALAAVAGTLYHNSHTPEKMLRQAAAQYLDALQRQDFQAAYELLSQESKSQCSLEEFQAQRQAPPWSWSDVQVLRLEPANALVQYRLAIPGQAPSEDFLFFAQEGGRWVRPYNWTLLKKAEAAFDQNTPELALILSQAATRINPRDPMAQGYLCEAIYYRRAPLETEQACAAALELSRTTPSKLSPQSLYHLHAILADTRKNALSKYAEALEEYDALLAFEGLSAQDRCSILLARTDALLSLHREPQAQHDLSEASKLCVKPEDLDYIRARKNS